MTTTNWKCSSGKYLDNAQGRDEFEKEILTEDMARREDLAYKEALARDPSMEGILPPHVGKLASDPALSFFPEKVTFRVESNTNPQ